MHDDILGLGTAQACTVDMDGRMSGSLWFDLHVYDVRVQRRDWIGLDRGDASI